MSVLGTWRRANRINTSSTEAFALNVEALVRVTAEYRLEMQIDTDETNAAANPHGVDGVLMLTSCHAQFTVG